MTIGPRLLVLLLITLASLAPSAQAEVGLRVMPRNDASFPGSLRLSPLDSTYPFLLSRDTTNPLAAPSELNLSLPALRADWYPFGSTGLRTSAGLLLTDPRPGTPNWRRDAFLGLGWTASTSSSSTGNGWRLNADIGASLQRKAECTHGLSNCVTPETTGLQPRTSGEGMRWNPFISVGASLYY